MKALFVVYTILAICALIPSGLFELVPSTEICTVAGTFPIDDGTCKKYQICVFNGVALESYSATCASTTLFNPILGACVEGYSCTQVTTTTAAPVCATAPGSVCPRNGRFLDETDKNCKKYRLCYSFADIVIDQIKTCPNDYIFNCIKQKCVRRADYKCPLPFPK